MKSNLHKALQVYLSDIDTHEIEGNTPITLSGESKDYRTCFDLENGARLIEVVEPGVLQAERILLLIRYHFVDAYDKECVCVHQVATYNCCKCDERY